MFLGRAHLNDLARADYEKFREQPVYGWFILGKPVLGINNLELIKNILVKDFNNFVDRTPAIFQEAFKSGGDLDKVRIFYKSTSGYRARYESDMQVLLTVYRIPISPFLFEFFSAKFKDIVEKLAHSYKIIRVLTEYQFSIISEHPLWR